MLVLAAAVSCAGDPAVEATTVLTYNQCEGLEAGVVRVDYEAVADIRGSRLLQTVPSDDPAGAADAADSVAGAQGQAGNGTTADPRAPLLVAISRGPQPTPGYGLTLEQAYRRDGTATVVVRWEAPGPDAVLAQMMTHPCLVVALPKADFTRVEVVNTEGEPLGAIEI